MDSLQQAVRTVTSKPAQRAAVNVVLLVSSAATLFGLAALATALFFQSYVPNQQISSPIYLQYGSGANPYGVAHLAYPAIKAQQEYDVSVKLSMPRSPPNTEHGNFMVSLHLVKDGDGRGTIAGQGKTSHGHVYLDGHKVLFESRRPALLPYEDPIISVAKRAMFVLYYILFPQSQARTMTVRLAEKVSFAKSSLQPTAAFIEVEAGQSIQIYQTVLMMTAQLRGLRYIMFHYRMITYVAFTFMFWMCEILFMCGAWGIWSATVSAPNDDEKASPRRLPRSSDVGADSDGSEGDDEGGDSDGSSKHVAFERIAQSKGERTVKDEDDQLGQRLADIPLAEEEDFDDVDDIETRTGHGQGAGTSFREEGSESVRLRPGHGVGA